MTAPHDVGPTRKPHLGRVDLANTRWYLDQVISFVVTGEDTDGQSALLHFHSPHGVEPPPHIHWHEDEIMHLLEGEITFNVGGEVLHAVPGDVVVMPRGIEHTFTSHDQEVKFLMELIPAEGEGYFRELSVPAEFVGPCSEPVRFDIERMSGIAERYGITFSKPVPE